ncbi:hypothetical protein A2W24_06265 [Microgenomates group bacterium RBG_16_45_19]|nr:MAG: hypothetical protein A2W24_06265 [Microgenomates group bacterium RBG_16_45_19]
MSTRSDRQRRVIWWGIVVVGVVLAVNLSRSIYDFVGLKDRLVEAREKVDKLKAEQEALEKEYSYKTSPDYVEQTIRETLNMGRSGEVVVVLPQEIAEATETVELRVSPAEPPEVMPRWRQWLEVFF